MHDQEVVGMGFSDILGLARDWPLRVFAVVVVAAVALSMQVAQIQSKVSEQAEQRFQFKVADDMAQGRFNAYKAQRRLATILANVVLIGVILLVVMRVVALRGR